MTERPKNPLPLSAPAGDRLTYGFDDLVEHGLLWLINATVFHPRGLTMLLDYAEGQRQPNGWSLVAAEEGEAFTFVDDPEVHARFRAVERLFRDAHRNGGAPWHEVVGTPPATT